MLDVTITAPADVQAEETDAWDLLWYRRTMSNGNPYYVLKCGMYLRMAVLPIVFDDVFAAALDEIRAGLATAAVIRQKHREGEENGN